MSFARRDIRDDDFLGEEEDVPARHELGAHRQAEPADQHPGGRAGSLLDLNTLWRETMTLLADGAMTLKVKAALIADERIATGHINVDTINGTVYLRGTVENETQRELAAAVADMNGAHLVVNELGLTHPHMPLRSAIIPENAPHVTAPAGGEIVEGHGHQLEQTVREALAADRRVNENLVVVKVENREVFLSGRQDTIDAVRAATETVAHVPGVVAVSNEMEVLPSA